MRGPVRILSDLHLGHSLSRIRRVDVLRPLISGAGTVVFNGDTWQEFRGPWGGRAAAMLAELRALCDEEGVDAEFLTGNHDPGWDGPGWLSLAGGRIIVTHGDCLFPAGSPWKREVVRGRKDVARLWEKHLDATWRIDARIAVAREIARRFQSVEYPSGRSLLARAWDAAMPPQRALHMLESWWLRKQAAERFLETYFPDAEVLIFGHFHMHHCWDLGRHLVIDTGSFVSPGKAHWVQWRDGWLECGQVMESPDEFRMGASLRTWRFL